MKKEDLIKDNKKVAFLVFILGSIIAIAPLTIDMYLPAFDAMAKDLNTTQAKLQLSLSFYFIGMALSQIIYGPVVDRFGKRLPLFFGLTTYVITSILCCFIKNVDSLIILRFFQALGVCSCIVVPRAIVRDLFSPQESAKIFSHLLLVIGVAPIFAPPFGSLLLIKFGWQSIFVFSAFFGIFCLFLAYFFLPKTKESNKDDKISHALKKYLGILKDKNFVTTSIAGGFSMAGLFCYITGSPAFYMNFYKISASHYSLIFSINAIGFILISQLNAYFLRKFSMEDILQKTIFFPAIFGIFLIFFSFFKPNLIIMASLFTLFLGAIGAVNPNATAIAMANQAKHSGSASALLGTIQFIIAAIFSALISLFQSHEIYPFVIITSSCGFLSLIIFKLFYKNKKV